MVRSFLLLVCTVLWACSLFLPWRYTGGYDPEPIGIGVLGFGLLVFCLGLFPGTWGW